MNKVTVFRLSLIFTIILNLLGAYFKISHYPGGTTILSISLISSLVFVFLGLTDMFKNENYKTLEKVMWTIGFIFLSWITGLLYYSKFKIRNQ